MSLRTPPKQYGDNVITVLMARIFPLILLFISNFFLERIFHPKSVSMSGGLSTAYEKRVMLWFRLCHVSLTFGLTNWYHMWNSYANRIDSFRFICNGFGISKMSQATVGSCFDCRTIKPTKLNRISFGTNFTIFAGNKSKNVHHRSFQRRQIFSFRWLWRIYKIIRSSKLKRRCWDGIVLIRSYTEPR